MTSSPISGRTPARSPSCASGRGSASRRPPRWWARRSAVEKNLGDPYDVQESEIDTSAFDGAGSRDTHDCIYYQRKGDIASLFQFCFSNGALSSKSAY